MRRRVLGAVCLLLAIGLLVGDETGLTAPLTDLAHLVYWLMCFVFTASAMACAFLDVRAVRRQTREAQRALLADTLQEIRQEKARKATETPRRQNPQLI